MDAPVAATPAPRRLTRPKEGRLVGGVAQGLALHLDLPSAYVRIGFVALSAFGGFGPVLYVVLWVLVREQPAAGAAQVGAARRGTALAIGLVVLGIVLLLGVGGVLHLDTFVWPVAIAGVGAALIWRQADEAQRARWAKATDRLPWLMGGDSRRAAVFRLVAGALLVVAGTAAFLAVSGQLPAARTGLVATLIVLLGLAVITGPWWWRLLGELAAERQERVRSQERAELAAHLHDSVLQTLALIQRQSDSPREVLRLARGQERELRNWLYRPAADAATRFASALEQAAAEIEDDYGVAVEAVVVGDAALRPELTALVQAAREALVNAAKHADVAEVSLYAEVESDVVTVFVRDRGAGFDPDEVPADRHGLSGSVVGRMSRHGGTANVRSTPGTGTEVELSMTLAEATT